MGMEIYSKSGAYLTYVEKVLSCTTKQTLEGVITLTFETLINEELGMLNDSTDYVIYFENEYYDVISIQRSLSNGMYKIKFTCEHVSYRLSEITKTEFSAIGSPKEILTELLKGTEFYSGACDITVDQVLSIQQESTIRSIIFSFADMLDCDVSFTGYFINLHKHRGEKTPIELIDKNVVSISKTEKKGSNVPNYSITIRPNVLLEVGDELHLKFDKLGIDENVRLLGITRKPYTSKNYDLEVGVAETSLEADLVTIKTETVAKDKSYFGVKISADYGLTVTREDKKAKVIMNANEFRMQALASDNILRDRLYFDPLTGDYKFIGNISVDGGEININNKFIVDENGNAHLSGDSVIYGGKYYAGKPELNEGFSEMTSGGFEVFNSANDLKLRLGYTTQGEDYPFIQLGSGSGAYTDFGLVKKFTDGLWIGNSEPEDESGTFVPMKGYNGIFFRFSDNTAYVVKDTDMKNIYTGAAIAKFG